MPEQATFVALDNIVNGWRQRVLFTLDTTIWGRIWEAVDFALNLGLCVVYIINTTVVDTKTHEPLPIPTLNRQIEFILAVVLLGQYISRFVVINANPRPIEHGVLLVAVVAPMVAYILGGRNAKIRSSYLSAGVLAIFYPARFLRMRYAVNRILASAAASAGRFRLTLIKQEASSLASDIVVVILGFASLVHSGIYWYSQANNIDFTGFTYLDAIYFVSMSATSPSTNIPQSTFSEIISIVIVALVAFTVPPRITKLVDLTIKTSAYAKTVSLPKATRHALVCGHIGVDSVQLFLHEFFNADHGPNIFRTTIVILHPDEPSMEMKALLRDPAYANRVFYVKGRATGLKALQRARIDLATCVYILAEKHCHGTGVEEDAELVLIALALSAFRSRVIHKHVDEMMAQAQPNFSVYAQTILPGSIAHMMYLQTTRVVSVDEMRMGIMAQNSATPGFATLAFMLSKSMGDESDWDFSGVLAEAIAESSDEGWVKNYIHGFQLEIYQAKAPKSLLGRSFFKVARYFYRCHGLLVFGVGAFSPTRSPQVQTPHHPSISNDMGHYQVLLAPRNYILREYDMLFAISTDVQSVVDAMVFAERVIIRSTKTQQKTLPPDVPDPVPLSPISISSTRSRMPFFGFLTPATPLSPIRKMIDIEEPTTPLQVESPRRVIARSNGSVKRTRGTNYISDGDSEYFSPSRTVADSQPREKSYPEFATFKGIGGSRAERVARRSDPVPLEIQGHIVICDASNMFPRNIELLVQALKQAFEDDELPIVILSPAKMDRVVELVLSDFANVYVVRGTPLSQADLRRTHIGHAQKAIVLGSCGGRADKDTGDSSNDSAAILANLNIQSVCGGQFFVTTELLEIESIRYHDHTQLLGEPLLKRTFMGGHIFMPALIDTALCQCYFSSHILEVLRQMTFSHADAGPLRTFKPGRLSLLYVPDRFIGKRYDTLVLTLMKRHGAIPLGIYRIVSQRGQAFACVLSNPPPYMPLLSSDAVYVLAPIIPGWKHVTEGLRNLRIEPQSNLSGSTGQTTSPASAGTDKNGKGSGTNQSRHTVYFHDTLDHSNDEADNGDIADVEVSDDANRNTGTAIPTRPESKMA